MDNNFVTAFVGLAGAAVGGATSFASTWLIHRSTIRDRHREAEHSKLEALFGDFIREASLLYADAMSCTSEEKSIDKLVNLYALLGRIRLVASRDVIRLAEYAVAAIVRTYREPVRSLDDLEVLVHSGELNFLQEFGEACRAQLIADSVIIARSQR
jgi:hypothetical protein